MGGYLSKYVFEEGAFHPLAFLKGWSRF